MFSQTNMETYIDSIAANSANSWDANMLRDSWPDIVGKDLKSQNLGPRLSFPQ